MFQTNIVLFLSDWLYFFYSISKIKTSFYLYGDIFVSNIAKRKIAHNFQTMQKVCEELVLWL